MLPLNRLGRSDSAGMLNGITKDKALPEVVVEQVLAHTDGVPLFIEELTSTLLESGLLRETPDRYVLDGPLPPLAIPTTLQAALVARLDRLGAVKDVAQIGAAIGREFSYELIAAVSALPPENLDAALERLAASGLISRRGAPPVATYSFKHALVQDAAYDTLLKSRRRQLHASIAKVLIERFPAMVDGIPEVVAQHAFQGQLWDKAVTYRRLAGIKAQRRSANREAVAQFKQAMEALRYLPQERTSIEQAIDIRAVDIRNSLVPLGQYGELLTYLREAEGMATEVGDRPRQCRILFSLNEYFRLVGDPDVGVEVAQRALALARDLDDLGLETQVNYGLGATFQRQGKYREARETLMRNVRRLTGDLNYDRFGLPNPPSLSSRTWLVWSLAELGEFAEGELRACEELQIAKTVGFQFGLVHAYFASGALHLWKGQLGEAITALDNGLGCCRAGSIAIFFPLTAGSLGYAYALSGRPTEGISLLAQSAERLTEMHVVMNHSMILCWLSEAYLLAGHGEKANATGELALIRARENKEQGHYAWALRLQGELAGYGASDTALASAHYHQAISLASQLGMRPLVAHCHLGLGKLYRRAHNCGQAQEYLTIATSMYRDMDMAYWLEQAEAEMRQQQ